MRAIVVSFLLVGVGGALGAMTRLGVTILFAHRIAIVPLGTFASNLLGCFIMGIVLQLMLTSERFSQSSIVTEQNRLLLQSVFVAA